MTGLTMVSRIIKNKSLSSNYNFSLTKAIKIMCSSCLFEECEESKLASDADSPTTPAGPCDFFFFGRTFDLVSGAQF